MDAALAALIGAGVGAVVPSATSLVSTRAARRDAREARLFDHRRGAYAHFISQARTYLTASAEWYWEGDGRTGREPPEDALAPLYKARTEVTLYGTTESDQLAAGVFDAVSAFTFSGDSDENFKAAEDAIDKFVERARVDLGVTAK